MELPIPGGRLESNRSSDSRQRADQGGDISDAFQVAPLNDQFNWNEYLSYYDGIGTDHEDLFHFPLLLSGWG